MLHSQINSLANQRGVKRTLGSRAAHSSERVHNTENQESATMFTFQPSMTFPKPQLTDKLIFTNSRRNALIDRTNVSNNPNIITEALKTAKTKSNARLRAVNPSRTRLQPNIFSTNIRCNATAKPNANVNSDIDSWASLGKSNLQPTHSIHSQTEIALKAKQSLVSVSPDKKRRIDHKRTISAISDLQPMEIEPTRVSSSSTASSNPETLVNYSISRPNDPSKQNMIDSTTNRMTRTTKEITNHKQTDTTKNNDMKNSSIPSAITSQFTREENNRVSEYEKDIFEYLCDLDRTTLVDVNYMDKQERLDWSMRRILIDWLVQVHRRFNLLPETLFLAVNMMDRFLSQKVVAVEKFQLLGITSLFIACKYEEEQCPTVSDLVYMVDNCYTSDEIVKAEKFILSQLGFNIGFAGPLNFVRRISRADGYEIKIRTLCKYFLEVALMNELFLSYGNAQIAASGMYLSRRVLYQESWTHEHERLSGFKEENLIECCKLLLGMVEKPETHKAVFEKYQDNKYLGASTFMQEYLAHIRQRR